MKERIFYGVVLTLLTTLGATGLWAQADVTIFGTVTDPTGAVVPEVDIKVTDTLTGSERETVSDQAGGYVVTQLPVGVYSVEAKVAGFKLFTQSGIQVQVGENRRIDIQMEVGDISEKISVEAAITQVETRTGVIKEVIDARRINDLPLNGRNPVQLMFLVAGVARVLGQGQSQNEDVSINGSTRRANNFSLDGGDNHDPFFNTPAPFPTPDALQEFSISTSSYGADKGRNQGVVVTAITRSGTNEIHGSLFEFLRNRELNARSFFANSVPPFKRNQYGGTVGGPILKNKTFFFASYQGTKERSAAGSRTMTSLTAAQRQGDFSALNKELTDPDGVPYPNNQIPASQLYEPSLKFLETFIPVPNRPDGLLSTASAAGVDDDQRIGKVDHQVTDANRVSGRMLYNFNNNRQSVSAVPGFLASIKYTNWNLTLTDSHVFSPTIVNSFTFNRQNILREQLSVTPVDMTWSDFGAGVVRAHTEETPAAYGTNVVGYFNAFTRFPLNQQRIYYQVGDVLSLTKGQHLIKVGGDFRRSSTERPEWFGGDPLMVFRGDITGDAAADLVIGRPQRISQNSKTEWRPQGNEYSLYVQDDWKISPRLTLNFGLRWDPTTHPPDRSGAASIFVPGQQSTFFPTAPLGLVYQEDAGIPKATVKNRWNQLAPRFGFAYDPFGNGKTSIRGAYGIFYGVRTLQGFDGTVGPGLNLQLQIEPVPGGLADPYQTIPGGNPFPFKVPSTPEERANFTFITPMFMEPFDPDYRNPIVHQWNFNIQRQLFESYVFTAAYVGNRGTHLDLVWEQNPGVFGIPGSLQERRPFHPNFSALRTRSSRANSTYHSLQFSLNKRFAQGFTILTNYTWSKLMDFGNPVDAVSPFQREWAIGSNDVAHRWVASYIWELPKLRNQSSIIRHLFGGWETNGIVTVQSGVRVNVTSGRDRNGTGISAQRPDLVGNPFLNTGRSRGELIQKYFEPSAFVLPELGTTGNLGRNILEGPGLVVVDFGVIKNIHLSERYRFQYRAEFFNLLNRPNFNNPNGNISSGNVGRITSTSGDPRVIQMALKFLF